MGLDTVELILRTEETFAVDLPDAACGQVLTVGDFYKLVLETLGLPYVLPKMSEETGRNRALELRPKVVPVDWQAEDIWVTLKALIHDQLQVPLVEIVEDARFIEDLRVD